MNRADATAGPGPEAVIFADRAGVIRYWGSGAEAVFGHCAAGALATGRDCTARYLAQRQREQGMQ